MRRKKALDEGRYDDGADKHNGDIDDHGDETLNSNKSIEVGNKEGKATSFLSLHSLYTPAGTDTPSMVAGIPTLIAGACSMPRLISTLVKGVRSYTFCPHLIYYRIPV